MDPKIHKADTVARKTAMWVILAGTLIGIVFILVLENQREALIEWFFSDPDQLVPRLRILFVAAVILGAVPMLGLAIYFWYLGVRVTRAGRFPLEGQKIVRDTPILEGPAALYRGRVFKGLAVFLGTISITFCIAFWWVFKLVVEKAA
jgi:uncharacterized integral membrane protein